MAITQHGELRRTYDFNSTPHKTSCEVELRVLSTDTKPTPPLEYNGSVFIEMDTRKQYMYDGENQQWWPI